MKGLIRLISMNSRELERYEQLQRIVEGRTTQRAPAERLGLSYRQMKRLVRQYRWQGPQGLVSRNRGQPGDHRVPPIFREHVLALVRQHYLSSCRRVYYWPVSVRGELTPSMAVFKKSR